MGFYKSFDNVGTKSDRGADAPQDPWRAKYPNDADLNFNYWRLLDDAKDSGIGKNLNPDLKVAIVGAGVAGLTTARELFRCGFTNIHIYEASDRLGGRTYSRPIPGRHTTLEMGAMRMPYFPADDDTPVPGTKNSVIDYYTTRFEIATQDFPNPGSSAAASTGIYLHNGLGPEPIANPLPNAPELPIWQEDESGLKPPTQALKAVLAKWSAFAKLFKEKVEQEYGTDNWSNFWDRVRSHYHALNFRDFVRIPLNENPQANEKGQFGGLGMTQKESNLFYTIGAGDGAWGAFYEVSSLYVMRTLLFGFASRHQLIQGLFSDRESGENKLRFVGDTQPQYQAQLKDSLDKEFTGPNYLGVETFADCMFFQPVNSHCPQAEGKSLYDALKSTDLGVKLFLQNPVSKLKKLADGKIALDSTNVSDRYDFVVTTLSPWAGQMSIEIEGFEQLPPEGSAYEREMPYLIQHSLKTMHWITSCKVFYPLKARYWEESKIPQIISTDTLLKDVYGYALNNTCEPEAGVLLVSYTWEDDANKFIASKDDAQLASQLLKKLDDILIGSTNIGVPISPYVDTSQPTVIQWAKQPSYRGCAKLYREQTEAENYVLLKYNQQRSKYTGIYFAGEAFSATGGWTEPSFRGALDTVIHLIENTGGKFLNQFDFADYPQYSSWTPSDDIKNHDLQHWHLY